MKVRIIKIISLICCIVFMFTANVITAPVNVEAATQAELKQQLKEKEAAVAKAKKEKASQEKIKKALDEQIAALQELINACNAEIAAYNTQISERQAKIDKQLADMEKDKELFRKRIREIYMSGNQSNVQILLGAENFSEFLVLAQMTKNLSAKDAKMIEKINAAIKVIEKEQAEIQVLLDKQLAVKKELNSQKKSLDSKVSEVNGVISKLNRDIKADQAAMDKISSQINSGSSNSNIIFSGGNFLWPVAGHYYISAGWQSGDAVHKGNHKGIDIAGGGIAGKPVRAAADGYVYYVNNSCRHNYGKNYSCGCGGGYGNYVAIDHGKLNGTSYKTLYAHMSRTAVSNGAYVKRGQTIGYVGTTGWSTGNHLHFEVIVNGVKKNPSKFSYDRG